VACGLVQCASLSLLILSGVAMLVTRPQAWPALPGYSPHSTNATHRGKRYGKRRAFMSLGRMGTSSSFVNNFVLRSRRPKKFKAQKAKAATKSVVLVGSHFELGNALLEAVFRDLCGRPRLGLRCDRDGATHRHDLKGLSGYKGRKRLVWMDRDASSLLQTLRGVSKFAYDLRFVHLLWDPREACVAQWPLTLGSSNVSLPSLCGALRQEDLPPLYRRGKKREKGTRDVRALQLRLEELVAKKTGQAAWRQLFKFLGLQEKGGDLSLMAMATMQQQQLRSRVFNSGAPGWVREALAQNNTLHASLKKLRRQLEYTSAAGQPLPSTAGRQLSRRVSFPPKFPRPHRLGAV